jgi:hypothetical protein
MQYRMTGVKFGYIGPHYWRTHAGHGGCGTGDSPGHSSRRVAGYGVGYGHSHGHGAGHSYGAVGIGCGYVRYWVR